MGLCGFTCRDLISELKSGKTLIVGFSLEDNLPDDVIEEIGAEAILVEETCVDKCSVIKDKGIYKFDGKNIKKIF